MKIVFFEHWILKNISTNKSSIQSLISRNGTEVSEGKFKKKQENRVNSQELREISADFKMTKKS